MNKVTLLKAVILFMTPFTLFCLSGCAVAPAGQGAEWEPWVGELTGMIDADLKLFFSKFEEENDGYSVKGTFEGDMAKVSGGYGSGTMKGAVKGKVKGGIFDLRLNGHMNVSEGSASFYGKMIGSLSDTQAFGTWTIDARSSEDSYLFTGEWSAGKIGSGSQEN